MASRKYVIIIGAMKSGTTTLFDVLARHPAIAPASSKEPGFFAFDGVWNRGFDWFDTLFDFDPDRHTYRLEASTDYTKAPFVTGVWDRMTTDSSVEVKLIYIMRDPIKRMESHARHVQATQKEVGQLLSPRPDHSLDAGVSCVNLAVSRYGYQLAPYEDAYRSGNLHCLTLEDLKSDMKATMSKIAEFLEISADGFGYEAPVSNPANAKRKTSATWDRLTSLPWLVAIGKAVIPAGLRQRIRKSAHRPVNTNGRFEFDSAETAILKSILKTDLQQLASKYGVNVSRWSFAALENGEAEIAGDSAAPTSDP